MAQFDAKVRGIAAYVHVDSPDKPKWDTGGKNNYTLTVRAPKARVAEVCKQILGMIKAEFKDAAKGAYKPFEVDEDGTVSIKAKSQYQPPVYDIQGKPMEYPTKLGSGSLVTVAVRFKTYKTNKKQYGITGYLQAVQVLKLRKYSGGGSWFDDASGQIDAEDEELFEAFADESAEDQDEGGGGEEEEEDEDDLSAADF